MGGHYLGHVIHLIDTERWGSFTLYSRLKLHTDMGIKQNMKHVANPLEMEIVAIKSALLHRKQVIVYLSSAVYNLYTCL